MKSTLTVARRGDELYTNERIRAFDEAEAGLDRAMRRRAAVRRFLGNAARVAAAGVRPLSEGEIRAEIDALRKARRKPRRAARRR